MKSSFRRWAIKRAKKDKIFKYQDKKILKIIKKMVKDEKIRSVLAYIPLDSEIDVKPLLNHLRRSNVRVYVPFMEGKSFSLVKYRLPLQKKCFGIKEPKFSKQYRVRDIDLAIVPIVGVDSNCKRVGFGKGMYDRFFEREGKYIKRVLFLQRIIYFSPEVITQEHDIKADMLLGLKIRVWHR